MRKVIVMILTVPLLLTAVFGLSGCSATKDEWYKDTIEYYKKSVKTGVEGTDSQLSVPAEIKGKGDLIGYLLIDLDGDGRDELLIGYNSGGGVTKFTNVIVKHSDLGPYSLLTGANGYYIYLCQDNIIRVDSWYGDDTKIEYMKFNSRSNSFTKVDGTYDPKKWDLKKF